MPLIFSLAAFLAACLVALSAPEFAYAAGKADDGRVVKNGNIVTFQYTLTGEDGKVIESNKGKEPVKYIHGRNQMIPGFEKALAGMKEGGEKKFKVKPEDAYGQVDSQAFREFPKDQLPPNGLQVGAVLTGQGPHGQPIRARVHEIKDNTVVLDFNHPMAGKTLTFDVKVLDIEDEPAGQSKPAAPAEPAKPAAPAKPGKPADPTISRLLKNSHQSS